MLIVRTPLRISLFGGATDHPEYYNHSPSAGATIGFALSHYIYLTVRNLPPFHEHKVRLVYSKIELANRAEDLLHPAVRAVLTEMNYRQNIEITHAADLPARAGLGSSSAFVVGLINAIDHLRNHPRLARALAEEAIRIERHVMREAGGEQDQVFAAVGDFLRLDFRPSTPFAVTRPPIPPPRLQSLLSSLLLAFTGEVRDAPAIAASLDLSPSSPYLARMRAQVDEAERLLLDLTTPLEALGSLLDEGWRLKRLLSPAVSSPALDGLYERARAAGAVGGKLLGAGGGGFFLFLAPSHLHPQVRAALPECVFVPVGIDRLGSTVVVNGWAK